MKKMKKVKKGLVILLVGALLFNILPTNIFATDNETDVNVEPEQTITNTEEETATPLIEEPAVTPEESTPVVPDAPPLATIEPTIEGITPAAASDLKLTLWDGATQVADLSDPNNDYNWGFDKTLTLKFTADFPNDTDTDKKININISDDFKYVTFPTMASMPTEVKDAITSVTRSNQTKILGNTITLDNGDLAYTVAAGYTKVSLDIQIAHNKVVQESNPSQVSINPITVTETYGGSVQATQVLEKATISKSVVQSFVASASGTTVLNQNSGHTVYVADNIAGTGSATTAGAYVESLTYEVYYPEGVVPENLGAGAVDDPANRKVTLNVINKNMTFTSLGTLLTVDFKLVDDTLPVDTVLSYTAKASVKKYKEPLQEYTKTYSQKVAEPVEKLTVADRTPEVKNDTFGKSLTQPIGQWFMQNQGNVDTANKKLTYTFNNSNIGVTAVDVPIAVQSTPKTIRYKMVGEDTYKTYTGVIPYAPGSSDSGTQTTSPKVRLSNILLGETGKYFSEIVIEDAGAYKPGYIIGNSSASHLNGFIIGKFLTAEEGAYSFGTVTVSNLDDTDSKTAYLGGTVTGGKRNVDVNSPSFVNKGVLAGNQVTLTGSIDPTVYTSVTSSLANNLELYVHEKNGLTLQDAVIKASDTDTVIPYVLTTVKTLGDGTVIKKLKLDENAYIGSWNDKHQVKNLSLSFTFNTKNTMVTQAINMQEYVFIGVDYPEGNTMTTHSQVGKLITDTEDLNGNGIVDQIVGFRGELNVTAQKDIVLSNAIKLSNETEWYTFSSGGKVAAFNAGSTADYKFEAKNASGNSVEAFEYYIPVPKKGQNFGTEFQPEAFTWDMALTAGINVPVGYEVAYSKTATGSNFKDGATFSTNTGSWTDTDWKSVNMIRIKNTTPILDGTDISFPMQFLINETSENAELLSGSINKFSTYGYRDFTVVKGWAQGQTVAAQLVTGKVAGTAFVDKNKNGLHDTGDTVLPNTTLKITTSTGGAVTGLTPGDTVTTDGNGKYEIKGMSPGSYKLTVTNPGSPDSSSANPVKYKFTTKNVGTDITIDSDVTPAADQLTGTVNLTVPSTTLDTIGIGFIEPYTVTYATGANGTISTPASIKRWPGEAIGTNIPTNTPAANYRLEGWVKDTDPNAQTEAAVQAFVVNQDLKFTARFIGADQTLTFNSQGGTPATTDVVGPYDKTFTFPTNPTKSQYIFAGWYKDAAGTAGQEVVAGTYKMPVGPSTVYAKWTPKALQPGFVFPSTTITKTYGDANFNAIASGGLGLGAVTYAITSGGSYATINPTTGEVTILGAGEVTIQATKAEDATTATTVRTTVLTINKKALTVTAADQSISYGGTIPAATLTVTGFITGEDATNALGYTAPTAVHTAVAGSNAGTYPINISGGAATNYSFTGVAGTLTIGKVALTATAEAKTKVYGDANPALTIAYSGFIGTDNEASLVGTKPTASTTATATSVVGSYPITVDVSSALDANYTFNGVDGSLSVTKKELVATAEAKTKVYGDANPALTINYSGFVGTDSAASLVGTKPTASTTAVPTSVVGSYPITVDVSSALDANYTFSGVSGNLEVTKKALTATAEAKTKVYGDANPALTIAYSGFVGTDSVASLVGTTPTVSTTAEETSAVGSYPITVDVSSALDANYTFTGVAGSLSVTKKELTATAEAKTKVYGDANPALTVVYSGFVGTDSEASLVGTKPTANTTAVPTSVVGSYPITVDVSSALDANYSFSGVDGTLSVTKKELVATAEEKTKVYGEANPALTINYSGFVGTDSAASLSGTKPTANTTATSTSDVGSYPITVDVSSALDANYTFSGVDGSLSITKATQEKLAIDTIDVSKVYGDSAFSKEITGGSGLGALNYSLVDGTPDTVAIDPVTGEVSIKKAGTEKIKVIKSGGLNYNDEEIIFNVTVAKKTLVATAANQTKGFNDALAAPEVNVSGFAYGENAGTAAGYVAPTASHTAVAGSPAGQYTINVGNGSATNYDFSYISGQLTIDKAPDAKVKEKTAIFERTATFSSNLEPTAKTDTNKSTTKDSKKENISKVNYKVDEQKTTTGNWWFPWLPIGLLVLSLLGLWFIIAKKRKKKEEDEKN